MKKVTGRVVSSKPISLARATSILSNFCAAENGASQANKAYLRRAEAAFKELNQLHKDLNAQRKGKRTEVDVTQERKPTGEIGELTQRPSDWAANGFWEKKLKKKERNQFGDMVEDVVENDGTVSQVGQGLSEGVDGVSELESGRKEHKTKKKKKKRKRNEENDIGDELGGDGQNDNIVKTETEVKVQKKKKKKKMKSEEDEGRAEVGSEERRSYKKKRKSEGDS